MGANILPKRAIVMLRQHTVKRPTRASGVGLHSGQKVNLVLHPAAPDTGIVFRRVDFDPPVDLPVSAEAVSDTRLASCLVRDGVRISTVEHLMSALWGMGIDNLYVEVDAPEIPIMDGSAGTFIFLLQSAGVQDQSVPRRFLRVRSVVEVTDGDKWARLEPWDGFCIDFSIAFGHPAVDRSPTRVVIDFAKASYVKEVARARTFGFTHDIELMRASGLAQGGSLDNAIVMDEYRVLNSDGLRFADEFVRHKILDAIGDLYLLGHPLLGRFSANKSGHALNNALLRALLADRQAWEWVHFSPDEPRVTEFGGGAASSFA